MWIALYVESVGNDRAERMGNELAQVGLALIEGDDVYGGVLFEQQIEDTFGRRTAALQGDSFDSFTHDRLVARSGDSRDGYVLPGWPVIRHFSEESAARGGIAQTIKEGFGAAIERGLGQQLCKHGAAALVRIDIELDVYAAAASGFNFGQSGFLQCPVGTAGSLQVRDLEPAAGAFGQGDLLAQCLEQGRRITAHVGCVQFAAPRDDAAEQLELAGIGTRTGGVHQACGEAHAAGSKRIVEQAGHAVELSGGGSSLPRPADSNAEAAMPGERARRIRRTGARERCEVSGRIGPAPAIALAQNARTKLVEWCEIGGSRKRREATVADDFEGYALLALFGAAIEHLQVRVAMEINKSGGESETAALDGKARGRSGDSRPDGGDARTID
jgi:hypothetical protein